MGIVVENSKVDFAAANIGCMTLKSPFSYLGVKVGGRMKTLTFWWRLPMKSGVLGLCLFTVPKKINIHAWRIKMDNLPTRFNLSRRGMDLDTIICPNCNMAAETSNHIFFHCPMAKDIYKRISNWWDVDILVASSYEEWCAWFMSLRIPVKLKTYLEGVFYTTWWMIWIFCNKAIFGSSPQSKDHIMDYIVARSFFWCRKYLNVSNMVKNDFVVDIYLSNSVFELNGRDGSNSDLEDDLFDYFSEDDSDTASVDHLYNGEEEVFEIRTQKTAPKPRQKPSKMFDATFLTRIYFALDREEYVDTNVRPLAEDRDFVSDQFPIHDPSIKWKLMKPLLGKRKLHAKCSKDSAERKCPFRLWESWMSREKSFQIKTLVDQHAYSKTYKYGTLITSDWIARNYAKKIMIIQNIKIREIMKLILKKYKCNVTLSQARRGKKKALNQYQTCLEDHYEMLWSFASEILNSNPGSTYKLGVDNMPDGNNYFKTFYVCFKGVKQGWLQGCRKVMVWMVAF
nr:hypothetical protein [Tanacetum cinerariifolium]